MSNLNTEQWSYISEAISLALKSDMTQKHGCIIVKNSNIVGRGYNRFVGYDKYGSSYKNNVKSIHAEAAAINDCKRSDLRGASMYVIRYHDGTDILNNSKPCTKCTKMIKSCMKKHGLKAVYYSVEVTPLSDLIF